MRQTDVKKSLIDQLRQQGKETPYTLAIVEDYMLHYRAVLQLWQGDRIQCERPGDHKRQ